MIPDGWRQATYGDVLVETDERAGEGTTLPVLSVTKARGPMLASERFGKVMHGRDLAKYRVARRNSIVADPMLLWDGSIGIQAVVDAGLVSPDYRVYESAARVQPGYLAHLVRSPHVLPHYQGGARGTNVRRNRIARSAFLAIPVAVPPIQEQSKIADALFAVDDSIEATRAVVDQLEDVKTAMVRKLLTSGIPGNHDAFATTILGEIPASWHVTTIGELCGLSGGNGFTPKDWSSDGLPIVRIQNLNGSKDFNFFAGEPEADWLVHPGELLFAWAGSRGASFGPRIWPGPLGVLNQHIYRVTPKANLVSTAFLFYLLRFITDQVEKRAHGFKDSLVHLRKYELTNWAVGLPSLDEQAAIVAVLDAIEKRISSEAESCRSLVQARKVLATALLTGQVRFPAESP